jgi:hypothetical protein
MSLEPAVYPTVQASGFRLVILSLLYVMFPVLLLFAENLWNAFLVLFPDIFLVL